jgi:hypothetical protein
MIGHVLAYFLRHCSQEEHFTASGRPSLALVPNRMADVSPLGFFFVASVI